MEPQDAAVAELTTMLKAAAAGDDAARERLVPLIYSDLRRLARARVGKLAPGQTVQATDLVHEAWMRLEANDDWDNRAHFFGAAANAMRNILVEQARRKSRQKRDAARKQVLPTDLPELASEVSIEDILTLNEALEKLEADHPRPAKAVTLFYFAGLPAPEIAAVMKISLATAERDLRFARSFLQRQMGAGP